VTDIKKVISRWGYDPNEFELEEIQKSMAGLGLHLSHPVMKKQIQRNLDYQITFKDFDIRIKSIIRLGRDSCSRESYILRYGETYGPRLLENRLNSISEKSKGPCPSKAITRERLGDERWKEYCEKRSRTYEKNKTLGQYSHMNQPENFDPGVWKKKYQKAAEANSKITGKRRDNRSLGSMIKRHGAEKGRREYKRLNKLSSLSQSLEGLIEKYGKVEGTKKRLEWTKKSCSNSGFSKIANSLFDNIKSELGIDCSYGTGEKALFLDPSESIVLGQLLIYPDFTFNNKIIEFYGDYWHANPRRYQKSETFLNGKTAQEIWDRDKIRESIIQNRGHELLIIWESEYKKEPERVLKKCLKLIGENNVG